MTARTSARFLGTAPADRVAGEARPIEGATTVSHNPARPAETVWSGAPNPAHVDAAVAAARGALGAWSSMSFETRADALRAFAALVRERAGYIAELITLETGKALWETKAEAGALAAKVDITLEEGPNTGRSRVTPFDVPLSETRTGRGHFRPHGVMAVVGPFNFPAHLPNGHIVPALAAGCAVVFKPSDKTPAVGQLLAELYDEALASVGAPAGVVNLVQGGADVASRLVTHGGVDGVLFTGSWPVGRKILEANLDTPGKIVALEMGGNNPAIVLPDAHLKQAVVECARAAFATTGQRCTCTRRVIVHERIADRFIGAFVETARALVVGDPMSETPVFMGPIIREESRGAALRFVDDLVAAGGEALLAPRALNDVAGCEGGHFVTPGVVRVDRFTGAGEDASRDADCDMEVFAPVTRVSVVKDVGEAIAQANATRYGLAASIFTADEDAQRRFFAEARAGCVNVNTGTAGASSKLPFGGLGFSGNHRPAGAFSLDYCAYPVASMIETGDGAPLAAGMAFDDAWIA